MSLASRTSGGFAHFIPLSAEQMTHTLFFQSIQDSSSYFYTQYENQPTEKLTSDI